MNIRSLGVIILLLGVMAWKAWGAEEEKPLPLGVNLEMVRDWGRSMMFADAMKAARPAGTVDAPWDGKAQKDEQGWPTQDAGFVIFTDQPNIDGTYKLSFTGRATVTPNASQAKVERMKYDPETNTSTADLIIPKDNRQLFLSFKNTGGAGVKNVQLIRPGHTPDDLFYKPFLESLKPFQVLRFMDYLCTNGNPIEKWDQRPKPSDATQATHRGACLEYALELANQADKDVWLNVPDMADDDYVRQLAKLCKEKLKPGHIVYLEYSNEVWNNSFRQTGRNFNQAKAEVADGNSPLNADGDKNQYYWGYKRVAMKLVQDANIFRDVYGYKPGDMDFFTRVRPVLASQIANPFLMRLQIEFIERTYGPPRQHIYAIAGAPYLNIPDNVSYKSGTTADMIIDALNKSVDKWRNLYINYQTLATYYQVKNLCYEGGVDILGEENMQAKVESQNDPRMEEILTRYLSDWYAANGDLFCYFNLCGAYSKYGFWGLTDEIGKPTPKTKAIDKITQLKRPPLTYGLKLDTLPAKVPAMNYQLNQGGNIYKEGDVPSYVGSLRKGNTFDYLLNVPNPSAGDYALTITLGCSTTDPRLDILVDSTLITTLTPTPTGGPSKFAPQTPVNLHLTPGLHVLRLRVQENNMNLKELEFSQPTKKD